MARLNGRWIILALLLVSLLYFAFVEQGRGGEQARRGRAREHARLTIRVPELHSNPARKVPFENGPVTEDDDGEGGKASGADDEDDSDDEQLPAMAKTIDKPAPPNPAAAQDKDADDDTPVMVFAIMSAHRQVPTVQDLLKHLIEEIGEDQRKKFPVLVSQSASFVDDTPAKTFGIPIWRPTDLSIYSKADEAAANRVLNGHDPPDRVRWRTTQVIDYILLLERLLSAPEYAKARYFAILEDDIMPARQVANKMVDFIEKTLPHARSESAAVAGFYTFYSGVEYSKETTVLPLYTESDGDCKCGAVANVFPRERVAEYAAYLRQHMQQWPVDFQIPFYTRDAKLRAFECLPNLFQHMGAQSTFTGNRGRDKFKSFSYVYDEPTSVLMARYPPDANGYHGCFNDRLGFARDLSGFARSNVHSVRECCAFCPARLFRFCALSMAGGHCSCSNDFGRYGRTSDTARCSSACPGGAREMHCGGSGDSPDTVTSAVYSVDLVH